MISFKSKFFVYYLLVTCLFSIVENCPFKSYKRSSSKKETHMKTIVSTLNPSTENLNQTSSTTIYTQITSTIFDPCLPEPCLNNGTCKRVQNSFSCNCSIGFAGSNCNLLTSLTYLVNVFTSSQSFSGTNAIVSITIRGKLSSSPTIQLLNSETYTNKFEEGHNDVFRFSFINLGTIANITIGHDGSGLNSAWSLSHVIIQVLEMNKNYTFNHNALIKSPNLYVDLYPVV